jgi:Na+-translocating ferredoxin:NAD+ oxidoreductase RnfG subunit
MIVAMVALTASVAAASELSRDEALALAYPGAAIRPEQVFLTPEQQRLAAEQAGVEIPSALVARYIATKDDQVVGRAYVDTSTVRTKKETLLISLDDRGRVKRVDVTAFLEPAEYRAPDAWLRQYSDRGLTDDLGLNKAIRPIAGATLTARAVNAAVRRVLAVDQILHGGRG